MTHFADADGEPGIARQVVAFEAATRDLPGERSLANSAATLRHAVAADWVRAGIMSYGSAPDFPQHDIAHWGLRPTMTLRSRRSPRSGSWPATRWAMAAVSWRSSR